MTEIEPPWVPAIGDEVQHVSLGVVGRVTHHNPAVDDEVRVEWASHPASWVRIGSLVPYPN